MRLFCSFLTVGATVVITSCNNQSDSSQPTVGATSQQKNSLVAQGHVLFQSCMTCHNLKTDATGPALGGVLSRWNNDSAAVKAFILDAPKEIANRSSTRVIQVYDKFKPAVMPAFSNFSNDELDALIAYMQDSPTNK